jgi:hypothetical protein
MSDQNIGEVDTGLTVTNDQVMAKTYTQEEVDSMMARMRGSLEKKLLKPYQDLGDPEELRTIKTEYERKQQELAVKKGDFERVLQDLAAKKDQEISKRDQLIKEYRVTTPLLAAAAKFRAVNAEQVKALVNPYVGLNADGDVEVRDAQGKVRYKDTGEAMGVEDLVQEFLTANPHFVAAGAATTHTKSSVPNAGVGEVDITKLDMRDPEDRKIYAQYRKAQGFN